MKFLRALGLAALLLKDIPYDEAFGREICRHCSVRWRAARRQR